MSSLAPYAAILGARFRTLLQYRLAAFAAMWTQLVFGVILISIYDGFYRSVDPTTQPMAFEQVASYVWLGQALWAMLPWNPDREIATLIRSGDVAYELCRPIDLYVLWYARAIAGRVAPTVLRMAPLIVIAALVLPAVGLDTWRLQPPASLAAALGFVAALVGALLLGCAITVLLNISTMWTVAADGVQILVSTLVPLLSGMLAPLPLFPAWAQAVLRWLPFSALVDAPFRIYTGNLASGELAWVLGRQLGWTVVLVGLGRALLRRGLARIVVQGG